MLPEKEKEAERRERRMKKQTPREPMLCDKERVFRL